MLLGNQNFFEESFSHEGIKIRVANFFFSANYILNVELFLLIIAFFQVTFILRLCRFTVQGKECISFLEWFSH